MSLDIHKHELVPKHTKLSDSERSKLFAEYNVEGKGLPKISKLDPAIEKLDVKVGDIIKIERISKTAGLTNYYRQVN